MAQLFLTESVESKEITSSSEGTRIASREWLASCAAEAFEFFDVNSVKGRRGPSLSGCSLRIGGDWGTPCCGACRGAPATFASTGGCAGQCRHRGMARRHVAFMACDGGSAGALSDRFHLGCLCGYGAGVGLPPT
ncbi:hypothetical protein BHE74_00024933 [Ensete ventricosum]|nr:hypothetical protein BHE74_00024933 [Ensete ventricosum]